MQNQITAEKTSILFSCRPCE